MSAHWAMTPGRILKLFRTDTKEPKNKYTVLVATKPFIVGFYINTNLTKLQEIRPELRAETIPISSADGFPFLHHLSHLDCSAPIDVEENDAAAQVDGDPSRDLKFLPDKVKSKIIQIVDNGVTLETHLAKIILKNLRGP